MRYLNRPVFYVALAVGWFTTAFALGMVAVLSGAHHSRLTLGGIVVLSLLTAVPYARWQAERSAVR